MSNLGKPTAGESLFKRYRILFFAVIVLSLGIAMVAISTYYTSAMFLCSNGSNQAAFQPETVITASCPVVRDVGQDLTLKAYFWDSSSAASEETIKMPAHLVIRDPNNVVLYDMDFSDKTVISFKPQVNGEYTATMTSLEDENNQINRGAFIEYSFGYLVYSKDVHNPIGDAIYTTGLLGYAIIVFGVVFVIVTAIKTAAKKRNSLV